MLHTDNLKEIEFLSFDHKLLIETNKPVSTIFSLPEWYKKAKKYVGENQAPTYKSCIPFFDAMSFGYVFLTPCDIEFKIIDGVPKVFVEDLYKDFVLERSSMSEFQAPIDCYDEHFAWMTQWGTKLPEGYSAIYTNPMNRFDLPFINTSGIIDNDTTSTPGTMPFFLKKGFEGIIKKGTPFMQIIPFARENWEAKYTFQSHSKADKISIDENDFFRSKSHGVYKKNRWTKKVFK